MYSFCIVLFVFMVIFFFKSLFVSFIILRITNFVFYSFQISFNIKILTN